MVLSQAPAEATRPQIRGQCVYGVPVYSLVMEVMNVNNLCKVPLDSALARIEPANLQSQIQRPNHYAAETHVSGV